ncbi:hypothetical protein NIES39_K04080 [Arthrospira platensis NIES-39]|nr:hypothetical protein NIES39_K04080 [Arthrospira platensis NIES-39]
MYQIMPFRDHLGELTSESQLQAIATPTPILYLRIQWRPESTIDLDLVSTLISDLSSYTV